MTKKKPVVTTASEMTTTQVARKVGCTYQRARNLMLRGTFGPTTYYDESRKLTVQASNVDAFLAARKKQAAGSGV